MGTKDSEFLKRLLAMFKIEAQEHLNVISTELTKLEKGNVKNQAEVVEIVYREAHTLKGAARSVNLAEIVSLCQSIENVFSALKGEQIGFSTQLGDLLHQTVDFCYRLVDSPKISTSEKAVLQKLIQQLDDSIIEKKTWEERTPHTVEQAFLQDRRIKAISPEERPVPDFPDPQPLAAAKVPVTSQTIRISTEVLDALLLQAEEMIAFKLATSQRLAEMQDLKKIFDTWRKKRQWEQSIGISQASHNACSLSADPSFLSFGSRLTALIRATEDDHRISGTLIDMLLDDMKRTLMLPFSSILEMFPLLVRDLARSGKKKVELMTEGGEIKIDRRVLEEMKDPLIHLVRNCVDHGMELPEERVRKKKSAYGNIKIGATSRGNKIEITVYDDGRGIDIAKIVSSAVKQAIISQDAVSKLGEQEALQLIFESGMTTSPIITDISGRGLGLAIVKEKVEKLNGTITVETRMDGGTTFRMVVPLTLATFRGTLVRVSKQLFVLPSTNVERVTREKKEAIQTVENRETLVFEGKPVSLVRLADLLELKTPGNHRQADNSPVQVVVCGLAEKRMAFLVDEILGEQEVLVKPLGKQLSRVRNIMGATVFGNGKVVPILNVSDLMKTAVKKAPSFISGFTKEPEEHNSVLVVEDSITARMLLKNILESAGYDVQTAVDGLDALSALKGGKFDVVVSDVEMPRMNGFDLTAQIRSDAQFSGLPVILVTALESREDRERGIDVGANAYIVKSSFDQSNLLEVIGRLT
jgi:two-component system, chemotaxis family, sensor kinase CheA